MKKRKKLIIILGIILLIIVLVIIFKPKKVLYEFTDIVRKDVQQIVSASGTVKPSQEINLQFETTGKIKNIFVKVGDQVKPGQILVKLNDADLQTQYQQQQAAVAAAKAQLALLKAGSSQGEIDLAENAADNALENLTNVKNKADHDLNVLYDNSVEILNDAYLKNSSMYNSYVIDLFTDQHKLTFPTTHNQSQIQAENYHLVIENDITQVGNNVAEIKISHSAAQLDQLLETFKNYLQTSRDFLDVTADALNNSVGIISTTLTTYKTNLDTARININTAISNVLTKQQAIASQKITNQTNINTAQSSLDQANDQLAIKKANPRPEDINYQEALVSQQEASAAGIAEKIRKTNLIAPINGVVTTVNGEIGETVSLSSTPILMNSLGNFEIELDVSETDIPSVKIGQSAAILLDAFPDEKFTGHVIKIDPAETILQGVVYYKTTISFDQQDERLKAGMTANVDIITAEKKNVLVVPLRAVVRKDGEATVKILANGEVKEISVQTGLVSSEDDIEIISGLSEGQKIISLIK